MREKGNGTVYLENEVSMFFISMPVPMTFSMTIIASTSSLIGWVFLHLAWWTTMRMIILSLRCMWKNSAAISHSGSIRLLGMKKQWMRRENKKMKFTIRTLLGERKKEYWWVGSLDDHQPHEYILFSIMFGEHLATHCVFNQKKCFSRTFFSRTKIF